MPFANRIIGGGGALVYPAIKSRNFVAHVSGWSINKDGTAEFNNLTIRGVFAGTNFIINTNGLFAYSSAPAFGNLAASVVPGTTNVVDPFGNTAKPGITSYSGNTLAQLLTGALFIGNTVFAQQGVIQGEIGIGTGATLISSPKTNNSDNAAQIILESQLTGSASIIQFIGNLTQLSPAFAAVFAPFSITTTALGETDIKSPLISNTDTPAEIALKSAQQTTVFPLAQFVGTDALIDGAINSSGGTPTHTSFITTDTLGGNTAALANSWTGSLKYKLNNDRTVTVKGLVTAPVGVGNPSSINAAPASVYLPTSTEYLTATEDPGGAHLGQALICQVLTTGIIQIFDATAGESVRISGRYTLDL